MKCNCAGTAPGYPQHEAYCGQEPDEHYPVWRYRESVDGADSEEVAVCAVCSPKHTIEEAWALWPCEWTADEG